MTFAAVAAPRTPCQNITGKRCQGEKRDREKYGEYAVESWHEGQDADEQIGRAPHRDPTPSDEVPAVRRVP